MEQVTIGLAQLSEVRRLEVLKRFVHGLTYVNDELGITYDYLMSDEWSKWFSPENLESWAKMIECPTFRFWVARTRGGLLAGYAIANKAMYTSQELRAMYLHPDFQGQGIGNRLMTEAFSWLDQNRWTKLFVASYNDQAIRFYGKHGFRIRRDLIELPSYGKVPLVAMLCPPGRYRQVKEAA